MTFFNKKEDVLDIKLTRYGREQLSRGNLKPAYYAFFDDDILYDSEYAGQTEGQNETESRIQEDTVSLRTQPNHEGAEVSLNSNEEGQRTGDKHYSLAFPLGDSALSSEYNPAWDIKFLKGELSSSVDYMTGSHMSMRIPQIDIEVKYKSIVRSTEDVVLNGAGEFSPFDGGLKNVDDTIIYQADATTLVSQVFPDGTYLEILQDPVLIEIFEENTEFALENISIEMYEIERVDVSGSVKNPGAATADETKKFVYKPLKFMKKYSNIKNDLLIPDEEVETDNVPLDSNYVEYYLDVLVDREIPEHEICEGIQKLKKRQIDVGDFLEEYDCEKSTTGPLNVYNSNVDAAEDEASDVDCEETENCP